ncbi:hypothetical protein BJ322DRAFT_185583 [Thelephora terrestris]|uniref:Uncharacterized protein n=1 Tax=Thelephora terrestris TaxID=56493 RepID=A0A9P6HAG6_9AGAM|nr:hypothetical protein BJ322DRAFT_185583 [Thelephora terrestris]
MAPRPGPLRELPLEQFVAAPFTPIPTTPRRAHKRSISPGTPNLFSPTKRRILAQEGVFSPEKTIKSSIVPSGRVLTIHGVLRTSPARKLDFGQLPQTDGKVTSTSHLLDNCFMEPTPEHIPPPGQHDRDHPSIPIFSAFLPQPFPISSSPSNHSANIHYPGFDVWTDRDPSSSFLLSHSSSGVFHASDEEKANSHDDKENVHPKTKWRTGLSKRMKKVSFVSPEQPRRPNTPKIPFTPLNARSSLAARLPCQLTPGKALKIDNDELKRRKEWLAMELDGDESSDDDL